MKKLKVPNRVSRKFHRAGLTLKKHSPEILLVTGVVGVVASGVMACKATLKVNNIAEESKEVVDKINEATERGHNDAGETYTLEDAKKDLAIHRVQTGFKYVKLYAPAAVLGVTSIACILASNNIIRKRNLALAAAYTTIDTSFKDYRKRVVDRFGKELDRELKYGIKAKEVEETVVNEDGSEAVVKKTVEVIERPMHSQYARIFDETCPHWEKNADYNRMFLLQTQEYLNQKLQEQGYLFLNDAYEALGFQKTNYGQIIGWIYDEKNPIGDNFVDFGIWDVHDENKRLFINGYERSIIIDFNVDGNILDLIP